MGDSQSQKAGDGSSLVQAWGTVNLTVGLSYADVRQLITEEREKNIQAVWERAQEMLRNVGRTPTPVPMKHLFPLLQSASLEDDKTLQERWAALLANSCEGHYPRSFVDILSRLSRTDAIFLQGLFEYVKKSADWMLDGSLGFTGLEVIDLGDSVGMIGRYADLGLTQNPASILTTIQGPASPGYAEDVRVFELSLDTLIREGLIWRREISENPQRSRFPGKYLNSESHFYFTTLAYEFVSACAPPKG